MVTELKKVPEICDFYINEDISETLYATLKKDVVTKLREIDDIRANNKEFYRNNGIIYDPKSEITPVFKFHMSTFGGDCYTGLGICDMLRRLDTDGKSVNNVDVELFVEGKVMSMGIPILLSVKNRYCTPHTTFMIHELSAFSFGKLDYIKERAGEYDRLQSMINTIITDNSKITADELKSYYSKKSDWFFGAKKAVELGLVKDIV